MNLYELTYLDPEDDEFPEKERFVEADDIEDAIAKLGDALYDSNNPDVEYELICVMRVSEDAVIR